MALVIDQRRENGAAWGSWPRTSRGALSRRRCSVTSVHVYGTQYRGAPKASNGCADVAPEFDTIGVPQRSRFGGVVIDQRRSVEGHAHYDRLKGTPAALDGISATSSVSSATAEDWPYAGCAQPGRKGAGIKPGRRCSVTTSNQSERGAESPARPDGAVLEHTVSLRQMGLAGGALRRHLLAVVAWQPSPEDYFTVASDVGGHSSIRLAGGRQRPGRDPLPLNEGSSPHTRDAR